MQITSGNAGSRNPENRIQNEAMYPRTTPAAPTALNHKCLDARPFLVTHQTTDNGSLLKSYLQSDTTPLLCQYLLGEPLVAAA